MAAILVAGFLLASRQELRSAELDIGMLDYLFAALPLVLLAGSAARRGRPVVPGRALGLRLGRPCWPCRCWSPPGWPRRCAGISSVASCSWTGRRAGLGADLVGVNLGGAIWWTWWPRSCGRCPWVCSARPPGAGTRRARGRHPGQPR